MSSRADDVRRLEALRKTELLDSPTEPAFDRFTRLAARLLAAPVALLSLVDDRRQFFKSQTGLPEPWASRRQTPLSHSLCLTVVQSGIPLIVADAREIPSLSKNGAIRDLGVIAYAGVPLTDASGATLGAFCVADSRPRTWGDEELRTLDDLAAAVLAEIELRTAARELKRSTARAAEQAALMTSVLDAIADPLVVTDRAGTILVTNPPARRVLERLSPGHDPRADPGAASRVCLPDGRPYPHDQLPRARVLRGEPARDLEMVLRLLPDETRIHSVTAAPLRDESGEVVAIVSVSRDVTGQRELEAARDLAEAKLRASLQEKNALLEEVHHRVKNNLQVVSSLLRLQADRMVDPDVRAAFRESHDRVRSIAALHELLYKHGRFDSVQLQEYFQDIADALLRARAGPWFPAIDVEARDVDEGVDLALPCGLIVNELLTNALKHAFPAEQAGARIRVLAERSTGEVRLEVQDNGTGAALDRAPPSSLGLHIVLGLARQLGADIQVDTERGTRWTMRVPRPNEEPKT